MSITEVDVIEIADKVIQAEADIKALAESMQKLIDGIRQLKAVQDETLAVMRSLASGRSTSSN
jgi:hypothetical protein